MMETASGKLPSATFAPGRGPRLVVMNRSQQGYGFTLRHFIVYPPDEDSDYPEELKRRIASGALGNPKEPMDTIFVKQVRENSPAALASLVPGDRVIQVNGESVLGKSYAQVVQMIQSSGPTLRLLVVPKEEDIIQLCFEETAHAPQTNPRPSITMPQPAVAQPQVPPRQRNHNQLLLNLSRPKPYSSQPTESTQRPLTVPRVQTRAQIILQPECSVKRCAQVVQPGSYPQGRVQEVKQPSGSGPAPSGQVTHQQQVLAQKRSFLEQPIPSYLNRSLSPVPLSTGGLALPERNLNRSLSPHEPRSRYSLALDGSGSLSESGSRRSYVSIDPSKPFSAFHYLKSQEGTISNSAPSLNSQRKVDATSTGSLPQMNERRDSAVSNVSMDTNDSVMNRLRKSFEQKEEFLNRPSQPYWNASQSPPVTREFYVQPQKLPKPLVWPPPSQRLQHSHSLPNEESTVCEQKGTYSTSVDIPESKTSVEQRTFVKSVEPWSLVFSVRKITPPSAEGNVSPTHTIITSGSVGNTTPKPFYGSSSSVSSGSESPSVSPSVIGVKQKAFVTTLSMISENSEKKRAPLARIDEMVQTPSPILDKNEAKLTLTKLISSQQAKEQRKDVKHGAEEQDPPKFRDSGMHFGSGMSGNRTTIVGSSKLHCEPPSSSGGDEPDKHVRPVRPTQLSFTLSPTSLDESLDNYFASPLSTPGSIASDFGETVLEQFDDMLATFSTRGQNGRNNSAVSVPKDSSTAMNLQNPAVSRRVKVIREDDEERAMRRISYRKATASDRLHVDTDTDLSDQEQKLSSKHPSSREAGSIQSKERSAPPSDLSREGWVNMKITQVDGKRATDRSWHQMWLKLKNQTLTIYKDKKDAQQVGSQPISECEQTFDLKGATVDIACDYTKRRHVLRLSLQSGAEYLLQCEDDQDMLRWMQLLQEGSGSHTEFSASTALFKAAMEGSKKKKLEPFYRNRSPTGHSPVSKTRKPSTIGEPPMSPVNSKPRTWKNKVTKELSKRFRGHGVTPSSSRHTSDGHSPSSPSRERTSFDTPLELCPMSPENQGIPLLVDLCVRLVEARGLDVVGVYRVPGNNGAVTALTLSINQGFENVNFQDVRWSDTNVISSLLKQFFRKLPDPVLTSELYPRFIEASKNEDLEKRKHSIKNLIDELPDINYRTLSFLIRHLARVAEHSQTNKMEVRNLAIVFGPTLIRQAGDNMMTMVNDMSHQCRIVETLISDMNMFFGGDEFDLSCSHCGDPDASFDEKVGGSRESVTADEDRGPISPREIVASILNSCAKRVNSSDSDIGASVVAERTGKPPSKKESSDDQRRSSISSTQSSSTGTAHGSIQSLPESGTSTLTSGTRKGVRDGSSVARKEGSAALISRLVERQLHQNEQSKSLTQDKLKQREVERKAAFESELERQKKLAELHQLEKKRIDEAFEKAKMDMETDDYLDLIADNPAAVRKKIVTEFTQKLNSLSLQSDDDNGPTNTQSSSQSGSFSFSDNVRDSDKFSQSADQVMLYIDDDLSDKSFVPSASSCPLLSPNVTADNRLTPTRKIGSTRFFPNDQSTPVDKVSPVKSQIPVQSTTSPRKSVETRLTSSGIPQRSSQLRRTTTAPLLDRGAESGSSPSVRQPSRIPTSSNSGATKIVRQNTIDSPRVPPVGEPVDKENTFMDPASVVKGEKLQEGKEFVRPIDASHEEPFLETNLDDKIVASKENQDPAENGEQTTPHKRTSVSEGRQSFRRLSDMRNRDPKVRRSNSLTKDEKTESNTKARDSQRRADSNRLHETRHTRSLRVRGSRDSGLKRRHTVGGTRDFDKVRFRWMVVDKPNAEERVSAWDQLQPLVNDEDLNIDRTLRAWMRKERLRTSSPELLRKSDTVISVPGTDS